MKNYFYYSALLILFLFLISCSTDSNLNLEEHYDLNQEKIENNNKRSKNKDVTTNLDLISENLIEFEKTEEFKNRFTLLYYCSEESGTHTNHPYLNEGYYLNGLYAPPQAPNLQDYLKQRYQNSNASGNNSISISILFDIYGSENGYLDITEVNRVYNEFLCQLKEFTKNINPSGSVFQTQIKFDLEINVDYLLCCTGNYCCYPVLSAEGRAYYN